MDTLRAILDRLIPPDEAPGALACDLEQTVHARVDGLEHLLERLKGFASLDPDCQDAWLRQVEESGDTDFSQVVEIAHEAFYADPRSWPALGYTTGTPDQL